MGTASPAIYKDDSKQCESSVSHIIHGNNDNDDNGTVVYTPSCDNFESGNEVEAASYASSQFIHENDKEEAVFEASSVIYNDCGKQANSADSHVMY